MDKRRPPDAQWKSGVKGTSKESKPIRSSDAEKTASRGHMMERPATSLMIQRIQKHGKHIAPYNHPMDPYCELQSRSKGSSRHQVGAIERPAAFQHSPSGSTVTTTTTSTTMPSHEQDIRAPFSDILPPNRTLYGRTVVELLRKDDTGLGLAIAEATESDELPTIANIQTGSIADRSDRLLVGDRLLAIENVSDRVTESAVRSRQSTDQWVRLEIEYRLPELPPAGCTVKHMTVELPTKMDGIGLVLRGGWSCLPSHTRPLTVMRVRGGSMADCDGRIKPGDRIVAINDVQTGRLTCEECVKLIEASKHHVSLLVEYNVANFETDRSASDAVMVEIEKPSNEDLGISLAPCHEIKTGQNAFFINYLRQGSIADRCGALFTGDRVEAIDDIRVEELTLQEAMRRLKNSGLNKVRLQIVPNAVPEAENQPKSGGVSVGSRDVTRSKTVHRSHQIPASDVASPEVRRHSKNRAQYPGKTYYNTYMQTDYSDQGYTPVEVSNLNEPVMRISGLDPKLRSINKSSTSLHSLSQTRADFWRCEEVEVCLEPNGGGSYGLILCAPDKAAIHQMQLIRFPIVEHIEPGGSAFKSGVIQEGDRVIAINGQSTLNRNVDELNELLQPHSEEQRSSKLILVIQYSVADNVTPAAGVFDVKLARRTANLGINLQASIKKQDGQPLLISKVIPGSVASRSGSINPGDILLAVNGVYLSSCSLAEAISLLQSPSDEVVTLRVQKISSTGSAPITEEIAFRPEAHTFKFTDSRYRRGDSVPESEPILTRSVTETIGKVKSLTEPNTPDVEHEEDFVMVPHFSSQLTEQHKQPPTRMEGSTKPKGQSLESDVSKQEDQTKVHATEKPDFFLQADPFLEVGASRESGASRDPPYSDERRRLFSSPEDLSQDEGVSIIRVVLKRKSAELPWGIIICGTDEATNAPVFIDSLSPGDPGAVSGLLQSGDRILAINGNALHAGHTLTQAMRMLQRYPDKVILHVARTNRIVSVAEASARSHEGAADTLDVGSTRMSKISLRKAVATSNFSRSFDSATNSTASANVAADLPEAKLTASKQPIDIQSSRPRSTASIRTAPSSYTDKLSMKSGQDSKEFAPAVNQTLEKYSDDNVVKGEVAPLVPQSSPTPIQKLPLQREGLYKVKPREPRTTRSCPSSQVYPEPDIPAALSQLSDDSSSEPVGQTAVECGSEFYPFLTDYNEHDLVDVQCPGCREAIINELRQRQQRVKDQRSFRMSQVADTRKTGERHQHSRRRAKSDPRTKGYGTEQRSDHRSLPPNEQDHNTCNDHPKAIFFCPEQELDTIHWNDYPYSQPALNTVNRYSKSDSRINLTGMEPEDPTACPTSTSVPQVSTPKAVMKSARLDLSLNPTWERSNPFDTTPSRVRQTSGRRHQLERYRSHDRQWKESKTPILDRASTAPMERVTSGSGRSQPRRTTKNLETTAAQRQQERGVWCTWIRLAKASPNDSYGIGVSEGLSTRGIFVSAIRPNSPADKSGQLHLYDRILMVNNQDVKGLTCSEVVGLISRSDGYLDLLIQRRITRSKRQHHDSAKTNPTPKLAEQAKTMSSSSKTLTKRVPNTNLSLI